MNHDATKFCRQCSKPKPRESFRPLPGVTPRREVCSGCYEFTMARRLEIQQAAMKKDTIPF